MSTPRTHKLDAASLSTVDLRRTAEVMRELSRMFQSRATLVEFEIRRRGKLGQSIVSMGIDLPTTPRK